MCQKVVNIMQKNKAGKEKECAWWRGRSCYWYRTIKETSVIRHHLSRDQKKRKSDSSREQRKQSSGRASRYCWGDKHSCDEDMHTHFSKKKKVSCIYLVLLFRYSQCCCHRKCLNRRNSLCYYLKVIFGNGRTHWQLPSRSWFLWSSDNGNMIT